jgi:hypothetical protein
MKRMTRNGYIAMGTAAVVLVVGGGVAFAFWTSTGTGTGTAAAGTTANVGITQSSTITGLYPGGPGQSVSLVLANSNAADVTISSVTVSVDSTSAGGCTAADFSVTDPDLTTPVVVPAGGTSTVTGQISMLDRAGVNQDACKGATINLAFAAS